MRTGTGHKERGTRRPSYKPALDELRTADGCGQVPHLRSLVQLRHALADCCRGGIGLPQSASADSIASAIFGSSGVTLVGQRAISLPLAPIRYLVKFHIGGAEPG